MKKISLLLFLLPGLFMSGAVLAADKNWSNDAELSFVDTGGNTEVTTLAAQNLLKYRFDEQYTGQWLLQALYGENAGEKNAESYATELRGDYAPYERLYYFATAGWLQDEFSGTDSRIVFGLGSGYKFLQGSKHFLIGEAGLTYTREEYVDNSDAAYLGARLFGKFDYKFNETSRFMQSLELLPDFDETDNWLLNSETAIIAALSNRFSMKTAYKVKYDHEPLAGLDKTDRILSVALMAQF
ncbi:MAG TPA: DUF481 domain-containing protein [Geopsychrobacteraceae bacterium]|nr:DUF481 domain-containing protein [Geopsychrobacteraceae bacterium]